VTDPRDDLARLAPYLQDFAEAALLEGEDTALLSAICLRETLAGWARGYDRPGSHLGRGDAGARQWWPTRAAAAPWVKVVGEGKDGRVRVVPIDDRGWGCFLFQVDWAGAYGHLPRECPEATPFLQAQWACQVLQDARRDLAEYKEHPLFQVAVVCRYNASLSRVRDALAVGLHPDTVTTPGPSGIPDYGSDVLHRRDRLRATHPETFPPAAG